MARKWFQNKGKAVPHIELDESKRTQDTFNRILLRSYTDSEYLEVCKRADSIIRRFSPTS